MQVDIRNGEALDRNWVYSLYSRTMRPFVEQVWGWDEEIQSKGFDEQLGVENFKIVSIDDIDVGGYCLKTKENELWLDMILIEPSQQNNGIGRKIVELIHDQAKAKNIPVRLCSMKVNPATEFYKHLGYIEYKNDNALSYLEWGT